MNKKRLLKLADLLEADAKNKKGIKFDLWGWGVIGDEAKPVSCGTSACAMGLAVASKAFVRAGLLPAEGWSLTPRFKTKDGIIREGFGATAELFEIGIRDARFLFSSSHYNNLPTAGAEGERVVAKRIRDFAAGKVEAPRPR